MACPCGRKTKDELCSKCVAKSPHAEIGQRIAIKPTQRRGPVAAILLPNKTEIRRLRSRRR